MRERYTKQLDNLHNNLIHMGSLCEEAIACAAKTLIDGNLDMKEKVLSVENDTNMAERDIEQLCVRLLLLEQPVASDLRQITAAQKMITDMERISDQAVDIAELSAYMKGNSVKSDIHIAEMSRATIGMVTASIDSFVSKDFAKAREVIASDDVVDDLFLKIRKELIQHITENPAVASECLDLLMVAKYFERIGDHAVNIAEWVLYSLTGDRYATTLE
ncbi:phosphate signaling complex protein PhoU [Scatolibacter rhodanostii]|uniref:phosphate signaling complex protein PhoU n=1 Tax=Scatolibacter rhodanostii TaxID=2014781 RepID=UPI000C08CD89|nr:phosphate signaling complex protein PhoU [Scatolibacter rhodanostii]